MQVQINLFIALFNALKFVKNLCFHFLDINLKKNNLLPKNKKGKKK